MNLATNKLIYITQSEKKEGSFYNCPWWLLRLNYFMKCRIVPTVSSISNSTEKNLAREWISTKLYNEWKTKNNRSSSVIGEWIILPSVLFLLSLTTRRLEGQLACLHSTSFPINPLLLQDPWSCHKIITDHNERRIIHIPAPLSALVGWEVVCF